MKIDYICFSLSKNGEADFLPTADDTSFSIDAKKREHALYKKAKEAGIAIVYNQDIGFFYKDDKLIKVEGKVILPRSSNPAREKELLVALKRCRAKSIQTLEDRNKIKDWPLYIQPCFRKVYEMSFQEFVDNCKQFKDEFQRLHIKTARSGKFNKTIFKYGYKTDGGGKYFFSEPAINLVPEEKIFVSESFVRVSDLEGRNGYLDYKAYIVDGKVRSISRMGINRRGLGVPHEVETFVFEQAERTKKVKEFPKSYVMDVAEMFIDGATVIDIVSYKTICSSELAPDNDLVAMVLESEEEKTLE